MKERILITNPIKQNPSRIASASPEQQLEKPKDYARGIALISRQECINIITKYSVPTMIMRFTIPAMIHNVQLERKIEILQDNGDAELKVTKIPILFQSLLLNSLLIFDDIGSNADIQRFSSGLAKTITHLVSDSRHSKNTVFFVAQRPSYLFKTARILSYVMCLGVNLSESDLKQAYEENSIQNLDFDEFMLLKSSSSSSQLSGREYSLTIDEQNSLIYAPIDYPQNYATKLETNGEMTLKNINLLNNDFLAKITTLEQEVNVIQQTLGTATQHISANGDFAFFAESGTVWMYDQNWYNSGDIVPDQVTPASDATLLVDSGTGVAGTSTEYSRGDHKHPLQVSDVLPSKDTSVGTVGQVSSYERSDHQHPIQTVETIPVSDSVDGSYGTVDSYARNDHSHPINVQTNASIIPIVDGVGNNGTSAYYSRHDHVHPQQLTYDGNVTATKFIKTGGLITELLCANGDTITIDSKLSRSYNSSGGGWIRLCVFPAGASVGSPFIEFKVYSQYNAVQTIRLVPYYTVNGINTVYGIFTAPTRISANYDIEQGVNQLFHTHTGSGTSAVYSAYVRIESTNNITIVVSDQSTYYTNRITEILTQDVVTSVSSATQIPITYDQGYGGFMQNTQQVNPTDRTKSSYNNVIRIGNFSNEAAIYLACSNTAINTVQAGQWKIIKTSDNALTINPSSLRKADHSVGLSINSDSSIIKFNGNELVNIGTDKQITGTKTINNVLKINPTSSDFTEGIRISRSSNGNCSGIYLGCNSNSSSGTIEGQWNIVNAPDGQLLIGVNNQITQANQGLVISADGQTLTFNGRVL
ncbi:MAG: hypothetical protein EZS28_023792 [Streblomastix strix]|uniref:Uncharacterized protein n=1 Tax=Streblomastix strix TaxID=222440 RepID=A0A5J4VDP9_9EUKA|nr:MAG: hypothetical protein EZS28_023792 [Streblomastix strix]